jgi:hypothetical protein
LFLNLAIILYSEIWAYSSKISLIKIIPLFIYFIYLFPHIICFYWILCYQNIFPLFWDCFFKIFSSDIQFCLFLNLAIILYSEIWGYSSKISLIKIIPLFIYFIYLFPHIICFLVSLKFCGILLSPSLQIIHVFNHSYKILEYV